MKTLYLTDLDGTLLRGDQSVSSYSVRVLEQAMAQGVLFSVATARSVFGLEMLDFGGLRFRQPLVLMNGVMLYDKEAGRILQSCEMPAQTVAAILAACAAEGKNPFLYRVQDGRLDVVFTEPTSAGERAFLAKRGARFPQLFRQAPAYGAGGGVYFSMQDTQERLERVNRRLAAIPHIKSTLYKDNYMEDNWYLEIFSGDAGKDRGAKRLQALLGADRLVAFGDNMNDLPLFAAADVACCVANGQPAAREAADVLVGANDEDGVARYIAAQAVR